MRAMPCSRKVFHTLVCSEIDDCDPPRLMPLGGSLWELLERAKSGLSQRSLVWSTGWLKSTWVLSEEFLQDGDRTNGSEVQRRCPAPAFVRTLIIVSLQISGGCSWGLMALLYSPSRCF